MACLQLGSRSTRFEVPAATAAAFIAATPMGNTMCGSGKRTIEAVDVTAVHVVDRRGPVRPARCARQPSFHTDVMDGQPAHVTSLIHEHSIGSLEVKYDLSSRVVLGRGTCGAVRSVRNRMTNELFAMKTVKVTDLGSWEDVRNEIEMQKKLDHPNICKIIESFEDLNKSEVYIIMELCTGGSLVSRMTTHRHGYGESLAATFVEKMLSAVLYCHHHGVVHRDIKLDNMIYEDEREEAELKLIDFGFAKAVKPGDEVMFDHIGTPSYMAPELWTERQLPYDSSVDMWALGVATYMLLSGQRPFHHEDADEKARMISEDPLCFPNEHWGHISPDARDFCAALMRKNPQDRLGASEAVKHRWITTKSKLHQGDEPAVALDKHQDAVDSMLDFAEADDLKRLALEVIAFSTPPCKLEELRKLFQSMDTDDSGTLSFDEFRAAWAHHPEISLEQLHELFDKIDLAHNGEVNYTDFLAATVSSQKNICAPASINMAFNSLDKDGDGYITRKDLHMALEGIGEASLDKYLAHADAEGRVSLDAFNEYTSSASETNDTSVHGGGYSGPPTVGMSRSVSGASLPRSMSGTSLRSNASHN